MSVGGFNVLYELYKTVQSGVLFSKSLGYKKIPPPWITSAIHFAQAQQNTSNIMWGPTMSIAFISMYMYIRICMYVCMYIYICISCILYAMSNTNTKKYLHWDVKPLYCFLFTNGKQRQSMSRTCTCPGSGQRLLKKPTTQTTRKRGMSRLHH